MKQAGSPAYLEIFMRAMDRKAKLLNITEDSLTIFLKPIKVEDEGGVRMQPIRSENELD